MGLDMYAMSISTDIAKDQQVDIKAASDGSLAVELAYWRKFNALHGWMEDLYRSKGGKAEDFNCTTVRLDLPDLACLEQKLDQGLEPRQGFFFGLQEVYPEDITSTKKFITDARTAIADGQVVLYDSWW